MRLRTRRLRSRDWIVTALTAICAVGVVSGPRAAESPAVFRMAEMFGVSWPEQPLEFRYDAGKPAPGTMRMIGPAGREVPYQWVSSCSDTAAVKGCIVVHSGVPASANYTWTLEPGAPAVNAIHPVQLAQVGPNWEVTNGLTGVRIATAASNPRPWNRAPIQGIQLPDGAWTGAGAAPNFLYAEATPGDVGAALHASMSSVTAYNVTVTDSGPMKTVIRATYTFNRPKYSYGQTVINPSPGRGHYTITLTMYASSKSILIDEDSDMQFSYYLPLYGQLMPDMGRYRGNDSVSSAGFNDPACGFEANLPVSGATNATPIVVTTPATYSGRHRIITNGQTVFISGVEGNTAANGTFFVKAIMTAAGYPTGQFALYRDINLSRPVQGNGVYAGGGIAKPAYRGRGIDPAADGFIDITYSADRPASYICSNSSYRKLVVNYPPAGHSAAWYALMYNSTGGPNAPVVGFYTGRASQQTYSATGPSMPGIYSSNRHWITGKKDAGIQVDTLLRGPSGATTAVVHRNWGIWVSTQSDLLIETAHQPIADDQNALTGINLSRLYTYQLTYPDPPGGWKWQYLSTSAANRLVGLVRDGTSVCGSATCYYKLLLGSESSAWGAAILNMWKGNSTAAVQTALETGIRLGKTLCETLANGDNHFDRRLGYYQLGLQTSPQTAVLNAVIMDNNATAAQKATAKAALALFGSLLWDNDWFPIDNASGEGAGLANQVQQYYQYRAQSAAAAASQPFLASKLGLAATYPRNDFDRYFSPTGAVAGSTHYQSAFFEPLILNYLNFSLDGTLNMGDPKWAAYANWELSIQTPPEPRFGNLRKAYSNGDGNTEADVRPALLGTALNPVNAELAGNLMWVWRQSNSLNSLTEDAQFGTTLTAIDTTIPAVMPNLRSINIPGYHSAERHGFGSPNETALWFINGGFYSQGGHRHFDDGQVSIYAHSAPLAIDWNANLYYPATPGRFMHNSIVFDSELRHAWSDDNPALTDVEALLQNPQNAEFAAFQNSTTSTAMFTANDGTVWSRTVRLMAFNPGYPVIYVHDSFTGPGASAGKTLTWNMMATGPVRTPVGFIRPTTRFSNGCQSIPAQLPSSGAVNALPAGLQQFGFTGASWPQHATGGVDWDLFTVSDAGQQFVLGNWGHGCHANREAGEYRRANGVPFAEVQDILRIHGSGPFTTAILPYRKTETATRSVTQEACGVVVTQGAERSCFNNSAATYTSGRTNILTVYDGSSQAAFGVTAAGGPQEVRVEPNRVAWIIGGVKAGARMLTLSGTWYPNQAVKKEGDTYSYPYNGGAQAAPVTILFGRKPWPQN